MIPVVALNDYAKNTVQAFAEYGKCPLISLGILLLQANTACTKAAFLRIQGRSRSFAPPFLVSWPGGEIRADILELS